MRYRLRHVTTYDYASSVDLATHLVHLSPRPLAHQRVVAAALSSVPAAARMREAEDSFGNRAAWLFLDQPHDRFAVTLDAVVDVDFPDAPHAAATPPWEQVAAAARAGGPEGWQAAAFVFDSPMLDAAAAASAADWARASFPPGRAILAGLLELNGRFTREFTFKAGVTTIHTPVARVLAQRAGVCQDFTNVMVAGLRGLGLPARYVSGYLRTRPPPGQEARRGVDQSHAWVGAWLGPAAGWIDLDPTNDLVVADEHVVLGWGRDYADVSPVRGIILGGGHHTVKASVDLQAEPSGAS